MMSKQFRETTLVFDQDFTDGTITFTTEQSQAEESVDLHGSSPGLFGLFGFGDAPFGGVTARRNARTYVPLEKQRASQLSVEFSQQAGYSDFRLAGCQIVFNPIGEKATR